MILLGDKDQLAAVESGAVFSELCADPSLGEACRAELEAACGLPAGAIQPPAPRAATGLRDGVVWLQRSYRFEAESGIGRVAAFINANQPDEAVQWLRAGGDSGVAWHEPGAGAAQAVTLARAGLQRYFDALLAAPQDVDSASQAFASFRVLCAVREGPHGVDALNEALAAQARQALAGLADRWRRDGGASPWFAGRPVMVLANDYTMQLFNGDIGLTLPDADGALQVYFPKSGGGWRAVAPVRLPPHETAFAMTVHKAQGSEFEAVLLVLPRGGFPGAHARAGLHRHHAREPAGGAAGRRGGVASGDRTGYRAAHRAAGAAAGGWGVTLHVTWAHARFHLRSSRHGRASLADSVARTPYHRPLTNSRPRWDDPQA